MLHARGLVASLAILFFIGEARADVVSPAPTNCPSGTHGVTGHAGAGCVLDVCPPGASGTMCIGGPCCAVAQCGIDGGVNCASGRACEPVRLCVKPAQTMGWGGRRHAVNDALAVCDTSGACPGGGTCETLRACVSAAPDAGAASPTKSKPLSGCASAPPANTLPGAPVVTFAAALAAASLVARRRRR